MFTVNELIQATHGQLTGGPAKINVKGVSIDSRAVKKDQVFIAVKGDIFDGHDFIADVVKKGVRAVIVHKDVRVPNTKVSIIRVKDTMRALGDLARFHRLRFDVPVIAITGSAGKTTTKEMTAAVLGRKYNVLKNEGTQNNHIGVPLTLLKLKKEHDIVVLECGTNQPGDIVWLSDIGRPQTAIFTNVGEAHLERLKTPQGVLKEKWELTAFMSAHDHVIVNADDVLLSKQASAVDKAFDIIRYGVTHDATVRARNVVLSGGNSARFTVGKHTFELNSCGIGNVSNALAAYACGQLYGVPVNATIKALKAFNFPSGRGQIVRLGTGWLINDVYNANPLSMRGALQTLDALAVTGKKIFVAADMLELGKLAPALHREVGTAVARSSVDALITVGPLARHIASQAKRSSKRLVVFACADIDEAQQSMAKVFNNGDAVLVKGSRRMKMEQMVDFLLSAPQKSLT